MTTTPRTSSARNQPKVNPTAVGGRLVMLHGAIWLLVLGATLVAGLWPFHSPKNDVQWLPAGNGLTFGSHGTILSSGAFETTDAGDRTPGSLEIWLTPALTWDSGTLVAFYPPGVRRRFSVRQSLNDLSLQSAIEDDPFRVRTVKLYVGDVLRQDKQVFMTITSDGSQARVYINGTLANAGSQFPLSGEDLTGELVVANSPVKNDSWRGQLLGLALYRQELTPPQILEHYQTWTTQGRPALTEGEGNVALYLFDEHEGRIAHNLAGSGPDLYIPERYVVFKEKFLEPAWQEYLPDWSYLKNVLLNIAGFIPLGLFSNAYLGSLRRVRRAALFSILLGCATSLSIEVLQAYLPTRDSGTTDLITNTLGTCLGVALYHCQPAQTLYVAILSRIFLVTRSRTA
ncbi:MAG TPA: VanZ family protein [Terriglobales bacterium]